MLYHLVLKDDLEAFQQFINFLCQSGWRPQGGIQVFTAQRRGGAETCFWYAQAMIALENETGVTDIAGEVEAWLRNQ